MAAVHQARWGEKNPNAKLTERDVAEIRRLLKEGKLSSHAISYRFNVSQTCIAMIKNGRTWQASTSKN